MGGGWGDGRGKGGATYYMSYSANAGGGEGVRNGGMNIESILIRILWNSSSLLIEIRAGFENGIFF